MADSTPLKECSACCETYYETEILTIDNYPVCHHCISDIFANAVRDESNYPPSWGHVHLDINDYLTILDKQLIYEFGLKKQEYAILWENRVYCGTREADGTCCGHYIGERTTSSVLRRCPTCHRLVCLGCKDAVYRRVPHRCDREALVDEKDFEGLTRGKDWQKCPKCHNKFQLQDGCNHVNCHACGESLCFICGQPAEGNSKHWSRGTRCPRYNQPGAPNAWFEEESENLTLAAESLRQLSRHRQHSAVLSAPPEPERHANPLFVGRARIEDRENDSEEERLSLRRLLANVPPIGGPEPRQRAVPQPPGETPRPRHPWFSPSPPRQRALPPVGPQTVHPHTHQRARHLPLQQPAAPANIQHPHTHQRSRHAPLQHPHLITQNLTLTFTHASIPGN